MDATDNRTVDDPSDGRLPCAASPALAPPYAVTSPKAPIHRNAHTQAHRSPAPGPQSTTYRHRALAGIDTATHRHKDDPSGRPERKHDARNRTSCHPLRRHVPQ